LSSLRAKNTLQVVNIANQCPSTSTTLQIASESTTKTIFPVYGHHLWW